MALTTRDHVATLFQSVPVPLEAAYENAYLEGQREYLIQEITLAMTRCRYYVELPVYFNKKFIIALCDAGFTFYTGIDKMMIVLCPGADPGRVGRLVSLGGALDLTNFLARKDSYTSK